MAALQDGSWLSTPGLYQTCINSLCAADPTLRKCNNKAIERGMPRVVILEAQDEAIAHKLEITDPDELKVHFNQRTLETDPDRRLIYIVEGLSPAVVDILGSNFMIHPAFFKDHNKVSGKNETILPSIAVAKDYVNMEYSELIVLPSGIRTSVGIRCAQTTRKVAVTRVFGDFSPTAMLSRRCSLWSSSETSSRGWNGTLRSFLSRSLPLSWAD